MAIVLVLAPCIRRLPAEADHTSKPPPSAAADADRNRRDTTVANDLATNSAHHSLPVPGEQFSLTVDYWTDYAASAWQTLQPKKINLSVHLTPAATITGDAPEVLIGSFSAVTTLLAAMPGLDGLPIAVTEQEPNALPGYLINVNYPYDNVVSIEGFDPTLIDRWTCSRATSR